MRMTFNSEKMKKLVERNDFFKYVIEMEKRKQESSGKTFDENRFLEVLFNSYVLEDSVLENDYMREN